MSAFNDLASFTIEPGATMWVTMSFGNNINVGANYIAANIDFNDPSTAFDYHLSDAFTLVMNNQRTIFWAEPSPGPHGPAYINHALYAVDISSPNAIALRYSLCGGGFS